MRISVIIPTYNSRRFIGEALNSVYAQSLPVHEVICVDDASTDDTVSLIRSDFPNVRLLQNQRNAGPSFSRNYGLSLVAGDFIAFLDADDRWLRDSMTSLANEFLNDPMLELAAGLTELFPEGDSSNINRTTLERQHFNAYLSSMLIRKTVFDKIGIFDSDIRLSEDHDWFLRAREAGIVIKITDALVLKKRLHPASTTHNHTFAQSGIIRAIKNSLDRRRGKNNLTDLTPLNRMVHD